jgi:ATP-binding cassette subfamily D (ALD) protein 3
LTQDADKWSEALAGLYLNLAKPILDIVLFARKLAELLGYEGPVICVAWYLLSGILIKTVSPSFGRLTAIEQTIEGEYRVKHTDLLHHSEEIAFYNGSDWERARIDEKFVELINHIKHVLYKKYYMGIFDGMLVKYGAVTVAYTVVGLPVFGPRRKEYLKSVNNDTTLITRDYIRNSSLLINFGKAIGRIVLSIKDVQALAGYTTLINELD